MERNIKVDDLVHVDGWGDEPARVVAVNMSGDLVVEHPMGDTDTIPPGWATRVEAEE